MKSQQVIGTFETILTAIYTAEYQAANRAFGLVNKLPQDQRSKHYARICATRNRLRANLRRLTT